MLDLIANAGKVANHNNESDKPKLYLFEMKSGARRCFLSLLASVAPVAGAKLASSATLAALADSRTLTSGDSILLEYLENVETSAPTR